MNCLIIKHIFHHCVRCNIIKSFAMLFKYDIQKLASLDLVFSFSDLFMLIMILISCFLHHHVDISVQRSSIRNPDLMPEVSFISERTYSLPPARSLLHSTSWFTTTTSRHWKAFLSYLLYSFKKFQCEDIQLLPVLLIRALDISALNN